VLFTTDIEFYLPGGKFLGFFDKRNIRTMEKASKQISTIMFAEKQDSSV
jgi:hypothetical protein